MRKTQPAKLPPWLQRRQRVKTHNSQVILWSVSLLLVQVLCITHLMAPATLCEVPDLGFRFYAINQAHNL